jgi:hypothetical protein
MRAPGTTMALCGAIGLATTFAGNAWAQLQLPPARAPCSVLSRHPCHPAFCSVFHHGPCFPEYALPLGEDLRATIVSTDASAPGDKSGRDAQHGDSRTSAAASSHEIDTIRAMFAAVRACWVPPPKDEARPGMQYTVRFAFKRDGELIGPPRRTYSSHDAPPEIRKIYGEAVEAALRRCTPLDFSKSMGGAIAGRPIAIRFIDDRTLDRAHPQQ